MASGDITSVRIAPEGWYAEIFVTGMATGLSYTYGWTGTMNYDRNDPQANCPYFLVPSSGYDLSGNFVSKTRKIYTTIQQRQAYPNHSGNQETGISGGVLFETILSDFIYPSDGAPVLYAPSGWVKNGTTGSLLASGFTGINASTNPAPIPIANWTLPPRQKVSGSMQLRAMGFHIGGSGGYPLAGMGFTVSDGTTTLSGFTSEPIISGNYGDAQKIIEYIYDFPNLTSLNQGLIEANFQAYPLIGGTGTVYNTKSGTPNANVNRYTWPQKHYYSTANFPIAVVGTGGSAAGTIGTADTSGNRATCSGNPFATVAQAMSGLSANMGGQIAGATIYVLNGTHNFVGGTEANSVPMTSGEHALVIKPFPGATPTMVATSNNIVRAQYVTLSGLNFTRSSDTKWVNRNSNSGLYTFNCSFVDTRSSITDSAFEGEVSPVTSGANSGYYLEQKGGWNVASTFSMVDVPDAHHRGVNFVTGGTIGFTRLAVGNFWSGKSLSQPWRSVTNDIYKSDGMVFAFNKFLNVSNGAIEYPGGGDGVMAQGIAIVQNMVEKPSGSGGRIIRLAADGNQSETHNCVIAHNTAVGEFCNMFYQDTPQTRKPHLGHAMVLNVTLTAAAKTDTFANDGRCTGNWPVNNGVGHKGNLVAGGDFPTRFRGLWCRHGENDPGQALNIPLNFVDDQSAYGPTTQTGNGDYHPSMTSPFKFYGPTTFTFDIRMLKKDLNGEDRQVCDAAGCYRYRRDNFWPLAPTLLRLTPSLYTYILSETFEGTGTPTGWTTDASGFTFDQTTGAMRGSQCLSVSGSSTGTVRGVYTPSSLVFPAAGEVWTVYMIIKMTTVPTGGTGNFIEIRRKSDNLLQNLCRVNISSQISVSNGSGTGSTGSYTLSTNTEYHLWIRKNADNSVTMWVSTDGIKPVSATGTGSGTTNAGQTGDLHIGFARSGVMLVDNVIISQGEIGDNPVP